MRIVTGITHTQVPDYLNAMDILAAPSQTTPRWKEQLGRMLIEGFASGLPVVGSNSGEIPSVLGDCGLVVEESSDSAWKKTLGELIENASYRNELGEKGRDRAITHFSWPVIAKRNIDFFDQLLDSPIPKH